MTSTKPDVTGVAHDKIDNLIDKDEMRPTTLKFIENAIATTENIKKKDTFYGQALAKIIKEYGNPFLKQQEWTDRRLDRAYYKGDRRHPMSSNWPVDTVLTQPGHVGNLLDELAHQKQYTPIKANRKNNMILSDLRDELNLRGAEEDAKYSSIYAAGPYSVPGTVEHEAHSVIQPTVQERFETLLDSLKQPISVESLFQNQ
tara:strand:+ start:126 stop:728 length:603 start_codon:yes stop_codon:yes gene_type:complete